jgi:hypothetical protein
MADEPATNASSVSQRNDGNPEDTFNYQVPEIGSELIGTEIAEQSCLAPPTEAPTVSCEAKAKIENIESSTSSEPGPYAQTSQHLRHDLRSHNVLERVVDDPQGHPRVCSHVTSPHEERDLERGELPMPLPVSHSQSVDQVQYGSQTEPQGTRAPTAPGLILLPTLILFQNWLRGPLPTEHDQSLINSLRSIAGNEGEETYRRYALGYGHRKRHGYFVQKAFERITMASSSQDVWWLTGAFAIFLQHLASRWVHGGCRKHFQTRFCEKTAIYLLQNVGDPSSRWLNDTLKESLGLNPQFFNEHLVLVYDGNMVGPKAQGDALRQLYPRAWHVWAVLSDNQVLLFNSLRTFPAIDNAALVCISFQRTDTDSCEFARSQSEATVANQQQSLYF